MALINVIKFEGPRDALVWESPVKDFNIGAQLYVPESYEALFFRDGAALDLFGSGRHTLTTANIPLIRKLYEGIAGKNTVFTAQVYYINKTITEELGWGTNAPIQLEDPRYGILINVKSFGTYRIQVEDFRKFLVKIVGAISEFNKQEIQNYFRSQMMSKIKAELARAITKRHVSILEITTEQDVLSEMLKEVLAEVFEEYGVMLKEFSIASVRASDEDLQKLKEIKESSAETILGAHARRQAMETLGTNYREMETFDVMKEAAKNQADGGLAGLGVGLGLAPTMGQMFQQNLQQPKGGKICPKCGSNNAADTKFCGECGTKLSTGVCPSCGAQLRPGAKFCGECGARVNAGPVFCGECGEENAPGTKFCNNCGKKLN